jgi:hypothetical protein
MRRSLTLCGVLLFAVMALVGCRDDSTVGVDQQIAGTANVQQSALNTVPFHAKVQNTIEIIGPPPPPIINAIFPGVGKSSPFGQFSLLATSQIDITVFPFHQETQYVLTFRNGDELYFDSVGTGIEDPPGSTVFSGDFTVTGGTGHFSNATGSGTYAGSADVIAGIGQFDMDGVISGFGGPGN